MAAPRDLGLGFITAPILTVYIGESALLWMRRFPQGPLEYILAWMTGKNAGRDQH